MRSINFLNYILIVATFFISVETSCAQNQNVLSGPQPHAGGKVAASNDYFIELVFKANDTSCVYLFDKGGKAISNVGITGKIIFQHYDSTISSMELNHYKTFGFSAKTPIPLYKTCDVYLEVKGENISAQFNNDEGMVSSDKIKSDRTNSSGQKAAKRK